MKRQKRTLILDEIVFAVNSFERRRKTIHIHAINVPHFSSCNKVTKHFLIDHRFNFVVSFAKDAKNVLAAVDGEHGVGCADGSPRRGVPVAVDEKAALRADIDGRARDIRIVRNIVRRVRVVPSR